MQNSIFFVHLIVIVTLPIYHVIHLLIRSGAGFSNVYLVAKATSAPAIKSEMIFPKVEMISRNFIASYRFLSLYSRIHNKGSYQSSLKMMTTFLKAY